jgi:hypothetical protein
VISFLLILLLLIATPAFGQVFTGTSTGVIGSVVTSCGPTSEPAGDVISDGFEGTGTAAVSGGGAYGY